MPTVNIARLYDWLWHGTTAEKTYMENSHIINIYCACNSPKWPVVTPTWPLKCVLSFFPYVLLFHQMAYSNGRVHAIWKQPAKWITNIGTIVRYNRLCERLANVFLSRMTERHLFLIYFFGVFNMYFQLPNLNSSSYCFFSNLYVFLSYRIHWQYIDQLRSTDAHK